MSQAVILDLDLTVADVGVVGAEPDETPELSEEITARLRAEVQLQVQQFQRQVELQQAQLAQTRQALSDAIEKVRQIQAQALEEMRSQSVDLALAIARKVIAQEIKTERVDIDPIVIRALQQLPARGAIAIHLNPEDIKRSKFAEEAQNAHARDLKFIADPEIASGGCIVQSIEGSVESTIESSFNAISETLRDSEGE